MRYSTILLLVTLFCLFNCKQKQKAKELKPAVEISKEI